MESFDCHKSENIPASSVVDQLNASDELLNLLSTEEECTAILKNIACNNHFGNISDFVEMTDVQPLSGRSSEIPDMYAKAQKQKEFTCDICRKIFVTKKLLKKHLMRHNEKPTIPCEICGKLFRFKYELNEHARSHSGPTFQCDICSKMFIHKKHLNTHRKRHLEQYTVFCEICNKGFVSQYECTNHKNTVHNYAGYICETCGKKLSSASALKEHTTVHNLSNESQTKQICNICNKCYTTKRSLKAHFMKIHSKNKQYVCSICRKSLSSKRTLETHVKMHTGLKDFLCIVCDKLFASKEYLEVHQRIHNNHKPYQCSMCPKKFTQKTSLTVHLRCHTGERPYKCECGKNFISKSHLMSHYRTHDVGGVDIDYLNYQSPDALIEVIRLEVTNDEDNELNSNVDFEFVNNYLKQELEVKDDQSTLDFSMYSNNFSLICQFCELKATSLTSLREHLKSAHNATNRPFKCWVCEHEFTRKFSLKIHLKKCHNIQIEKDKSHIIDDSIDKDGYIYKGTAETVYFCRFCDVSTTNVERLRKHTKTLHNVDEKPFKCHICSKRFTRRSILDIHIRKLHGNKTTERELCQVCGKYYYSKVNLAVHMKLHLNDKPFQCKYCEKSFVTLPILRRHLQAHTGDKPYKCELCEKSFYGKTKFELHKLTHTGGTAFMCNICKKIFTAKKSLEIHKVTYH